MPKWEKLIFLLHLEPNNSLESLFEAFEPDIDFPWELEMMLLGVELGVGVDIGEWIGEWISYFNPDCGVKFPIPSGSWAIGELKLWLRFVVAIWSNIPKFLTSSQKSKAQYFCTRNFHQFLFPYYHNPLSNTCAIWIELEIGNGFSCSYNPAPILREGTQLWEEVGSLLLAS